MRPSFAAVRDRYLDELLAHAWYDVATFRSAHRRTMAAPGYLLDLLRHGRVTAVEMHSHTSRSDGWITPHDIPAWTHALREDGYFRHDHLTVPLVVMVTDHDYLYARDELQALRHDEELTFLPAAEVTTAHGHVLYYGEHPEIMETLDRLRSRQLAELDGRQFFDMVEQLAAGVAVPAHPYREGSILRAAADADIAGRFIAVEALNGKTAAQHNRAAIEHMRTHGLRGTGGSDAHQISRLYSYLTLFDGPIHSSADLVTALREGDYFPVHGEHLRFKPR